MSTKNVSVSIKKTAEGLAHLASRLIDFAAYGKGDDSLATREDVEMNLKVFSTVHSWYDKTINNTGNLTGIIDLMSKDDKRFLADIKSLEETGVRKYKT